MTPIGVLLLFSLWSLIDSGEAITEGDIVSYVPYYDMSFMASLRSTADLKKHICAGSIIFWGQWIVTARSCLLAKGTRMAQIMYAIPAHSRFMKNMDKQKAYPMEKSFCHPFAKDRPDIQTDIGLIKLQKPLSLKEPPTLEDLRKIRLLREDFLFNHHIDKQHVFVYGWGFRQYYQYYGPDQILRAHYYYKDPSICMHDSGSPNFTYPNHICLRAENLGVTPCYGDDGGPAHHNANNVWALVGVVPGVPFQCRWRPYVMNISYFRERIDDVIIHEPAKYECRNLENTS